MGVPRDAAAKARMVYSTAKGSLSDALAGARISVARRLEWDSADFDEFRASPAAFLRQQMQSGIVAGGGGGSGRGRAVTPAAAKAKTNVAHPIYSLMSGPDVKRGGKKIVIPPRGAY
jgi:hypothetical protein